MPDEAASHFFQVVSRRYEHGSIVLTTNRRMRAHRDAINTLRPAITGGEFS